ncbi:MAG: hypothetical protein HPY62_10995 [Bacteroidales bacterium]|nr:hypothetical protein [Bacteroidales bacterium]
MKKIIKKAIYIAEEYAIKQLREGMNRSEREGVIIFADDQKKFIIDPGKVYVGQINEDNEPDAIVTVDRYQGQFQIVSEQIFIFSTGKGYEFNTSIESDMRILDLKDRIITAEVPTHSRNSPLFHCPSCREVRKFKFIKGELVLVE